MQLNNSICRQTSIVLIKLHCSCLQRKINQQQNHQLVVKIQFFKEGNELKNVETKFKSLKFFIRWI